MICLSCGHYTHPDGEMEREQRSGDCRCSCHPWNKQPCGQVTRPPRYAIWHGCDGYAITSSEEWWAVDGLCWDEMVGAIARLLFTDARFILRRPHNEPLGERLLVIDRVEESYWTITHGEDINRYIAKLTSDEALGFVAHWTIMQSPRLLSYRNGLYSGLTGRSGERFRRKDCTPVALLEGKRSL